MKKKACKKCKYFFEGDECPVCSNNTSVTNWKGRIEIIYLDKSEIGKKIGIEKPKPATTRASLFNYLVSKTGGPLPFIKASPVQVFLVPVFQGINTRNRVFTLKQQPAVIYDGLPDN